MTYFEKIVDVTTGKEILRPYTKAEVAEVEEAIVRNEERIKLLSDKAVNKAALLEKLGITEDEAKLLLG